MARRPSLEDLHTLLAGGARNEAEAVEDLGLDIDDRRDWPLAMELLGDPSIVPLGDGRVAWSDAMTAGLTSWQRVDDDDVAARTVEMRDAALLLVGCVDHPLLVRIGEETVEGRMSLDTDGTPDLDAPPVLDLPDGWEPDLAAADLVGFTVVDGHITLVRGPVGPEGPPADDLVAGVTAAVEAVLDLVAEPLFVRGGEAHDGDDDGGEALGDSWVVQLEEVSGILLADHGEVLRRLDRPFDEVVRAAGWAMDDATIVGPGVSPEQLTLYTLGRDIIRDLYPAERPSAVGAQATGLAWATLTVEDDDGDLLHALAPALAVAPASDIVADLFGRLGPDQRAEVSRRVEAASAAEAAAADDDGGRSLGLAHLHAVTLIGAGDGRAALDRLAGAIAAAGPLPDDDDDDAADGGWTARHLHALLVAATGDIPTAAAAFRAMGLEDRATDVERWRPRPPAGVGRNDRCPCGSGRKFKQCCLVHPVAPDLAGRVGFLWWKHAELRAELGPDVSVPPVEGVDEHPELFDLAEDASVLDGGGAEVAAALAGLLPADEAALAATWGEVAHRAYEVTGVAADHVWLRDLVSGDEVAVTPPATPVDEGDSLLAVVVPGPERGVVVGTPLALDRATRSLVVTAVASGPDSATLVELMTSLRVAGASD